MANLFNFLSQNFSASPFDVAKKKARKDPNLVRTLEVLESNPGATPEEIATVLGYRTAQGVTVAGHDVTPDIVRTFFLPRAQQLLQEARAAQTAVMPVTQSQLASASQVPTQTITIPPAGASSSTALQPLSIDDLERETVTLVMNAGTQTTLEKKLRRLTITAFKTFGPFAVLALTIPETVWTFSHLYAALDWTLLVMTWIFSVVLDAGFLAMTNLVADNKENLNTRQQRGHDITQHDRHVVRLQTIAWWIVAVLDSGAQIVFLLVATWGSHVFPVWLTLGLSFGRVIDLGVVMWVVSFAGMELTTNIDRVVSERLEMASGLRKISDATMQAREAQQDARIRMEKKDLELHRDREEADFLADLRRQSYQEVQDLKEESRQKRLSGSSSQSHKQLP